MRQAAGDLYEDEAFRAEMTKLFDAPPAGRLVLPRLSDVIERLAAVEARLETLEKRLGDAMQT